jgi:hypothetical protein
MKAKIFLSYSAEDNNKMKSLRKAMKKRSGLEPIVVAERRRVGQSLADKVKGFIHEANCLIPILTRRSITNQWVNQEIGYATALDRPIIPLVEKNLLDQLKGFIHMQLDLSFTFIENELEPSKEARNFRKCYLAALDYIAGSNELTPQPLTKRNKLKIITPAETYVTDEYVNVSGINSKPGSAVILLTSLYGKYLALQRGRVIADNTGGWTHERCHLLNVNKERIIYAISVDAIYEERVRELLKLYGKQPKTDAMNRFREVLKDERIPFEVSEGKRLIRRQ